MKVKNKDSGAEILRAELVLEGERDVDLLRRAIASYDRHVVDKSAPYVIPLPPFGASDARGDAGA